MSAPTFTLQELQARLGEPLEPSPWIEVDQQRIDAFARATEDLQWIHLDVARARASPFGGTIAHGFLTLSLLPRMIELAVAVSGGRMTVNYGLDKVRFTAPLPSGSRVRGRFTPQVVEPVEGGVQVTWKAVVEREGAEKPCLVAQWLTRHYQ
ncbi:MAG: MaoC family dehydratase [Deltaproteobacteria bacterium]|nr:MaoC family dehydratase [Deltaproteobacteria bacterium]